MTHSKTIFLAVSFFCAIPDLNAEDTNKFDGRVQEEMESAYHHAREFVRIHLVAPATASFSVLGWDKEALIAPYGFHQWVASGAVDSQNSFGAKLRENWSAIVDEMDGCVGVRYCELGNLTFGQIPQRRAFPETQNEKAQRLAAENAKRKSVESKKAEVSARIFKYQKDLAEKGDSYGQLRMGERYRDGDGVEKDISKARDLLSKSAASGNQSAADALQKLPKQ